MDNIALLLKNWKQLVIRVNKFLELYGFHCGLVITQGEHKTLVFE